MTHNSQYPKRLIEVDLPIKKISAHARREKSIRHGHISTLHIWWARRPLAACRAVICAALWPDPADDLCPQSFRDAAATILADFAEQVRNDARVAGLVSNHWQRWRRTNKATFHPADNFAVWPDMREALLDFIADFANWDASTVPAFLNTTRALTQAAHESLGGLPGTRPLVVDPFAGGGAIPLEALRVGADAFASDLNPVAVLLNKVVLEYIPKYGQQLADEVRKWGQWIKEQAEQELGEFYPKDPDGATPIAYLWARTIISEAPDDGTGIPVEVPLIRSLWLAKKSNRGVALRWVRDEKGWVKTETVEVTYANGVTRTVRRPLLEIFEPKKAKEVAEGTMARGSATCPVSGFTTPVESVRLQLGKRRGGANDARLFAVVTIRPDKQGRSYRLPVERDTEACFEASNELYQREKSHAEKLSLIPNESITLEGTYRIIKMLLYGATTWGDLFTPRQLLSLTTLARIISTIGEESIFKTKREFALAVQTCLALALDKQADSNSSLCSWRSTSEDIGHTFGRQALPMMWDFVEGNILSGATRDWLNAIEGGLQAIQSLDTEIKGGHVERANAVMHPLPNNTTQALITDPPYYHAIAYAALSDFFYVWLRRTVYSIYPDLLQWDEVPKKEEIIVDLPHTLNVAQKDIAFYEHELTKAFEEGHRILQPGGISTIVFASKTTESWEAFLQAVVDANWTITGSWPIDTEMQSRVAAIGQARLASSIHIVCRPRDNDIIGDWRDVLQELPQRIHTWLPRLGQEGVVGADAIFACLGPALEIYSRYSRVEKASGEPVLLKEYLEQVWAAVSKEALSMVFEGADASGLEEDARLTAMWLWTLNTEQGSGVGGQGSEEETEDEDEEASGTNKKAVGGFSLEYDAARKIAQGLGAYLEKLDHLVEIKGSTARLRAVSERARYLFGQDGLESASRPARKRQQQMSLFETSTDDGSPTADVWSELSATSLGQTVLDRVHQSMLLFAAGRSEALKHFLVDESVGQNARFWQLANALSALYPPGTEEKRWVEGVLARKKGLGF